MGKREGRLFTVGELAHKAGVTVRTLQYYDKCGLLIPEYSEGGRRMYNRRDVIRLQQILYLKSFGFSLEEIRDRLLLVESAAEFERILTRQRQGLLEQISHLQQVAEAINEVISEIKASGDIEIDRFVAIMALMRQGNSPSFILRYFTNDQVKNLINRFDNDDDAAEVTGEYQSIFAEMMELYRTGADPAGPEGQEMASRWWRMVNAFTEGDSALLETLLSAGMDVDNWPDGAKEFKEATKAFLERALDVYFNNNAIQLPAVGVKKNG